MQDAVTRMPKKFSRRARKMLAAKQTVAYEALTRISAIYHLDNELAELEPEERLHIRKLMIKPLVEDYFT